MSKQHHKDKAPDGRCPKCGTDGVPTKTKSKDLFEGKMTELIKCPRCGTTWRE